MTRILDLLPGVRQMRTAGEVTGIIPPVRSVSRVHVSDRSALGLTDVFRTVQILTTSAGQLSLNAERQGTVTSRPAPIVRKPDLNMSRSEWLAVLVMCLAFTGNAYLLKQRGPDGSVINLPILNPRAVHIEEHPETHRRTYWHDGDRYTENDIEHIKFLPPLPGTLYGLGPIQAAQSSMRSSIDMNDYMGRWFVDTGQPTGILKSKNKLDGDTAQRLRNAWNGLDADGQPIEQADNPSGIKVLDADTDYSAVLLSPKDAMWIEAQQFTSVQLARLFGVPSSLMLVTLEGSSQTYANVEQEWLSFVRFTLMGYLRPIEEALTRSTPNGQTVRFNVETLLRTDTKSRYDAHAIALQNKFMTINEVRAIEGLAPIDGGDTITAAPTSEETNVTS